MKNNLLGNMALCNDIKGFDFRVALLCYDNSLSQRELCKLLDARKQNVNASVKKLLSMDLLCSAESDVSSRIYYYTINKKWKNNQIIGQMKF